MRRVLTNGTLLDCVEPRPVPGASIIIEDGRIAEVLDARRSPDTRGADGYWFDVHLQGERETVFLRYPRHEG